MRVKISEDFVEAIIKAIDKYGSQMEISRRSGVGQSTINAIINPAKGRNMVTDSVYSKLLPFAKEFLPSNATEGAFSPIVNGNYNNFFPNNNDSYEKKISEIIDAVMKSNIAPEAKIEVYNIIKKQD